MLVARLDLCKWLALFHLQLQDIFLIFISWWQLMLLVTWVTIRQSFHAEADLLVSWLRGFFQPFDVTTLGGACRQWWAWRALTVHIIVLPWRRSWPYSQFLASYHSSQRHKRLWYNQFLSELQFIEKRRCVNFRRWGTRFTKACQVAFALLHRHETDARSWDQIMPEYWRPISCSLDEWRED